MGFLKSFGTLAIYVTFTLAIITFLPGLPPRAEFSEYSVSPPEVERYELKDRLNKAELLLASELKGPESFDAYNGELYTGLHGGYVAKLQENRVVPIVKFGQKCEGIWQEEKCGRPLGLKFDRRGNLYVADAYYGIFKVDVATGQYKNLVNISEPIDGKVPKIPNGLDVAKNGDVYWTDSSTEFALYDGVYTMLSDPSGRLIRYNAATKKNEVILKNLGFPNGVKLSEDESFVLVAETMLSLVAKYHLKGPKAGQRETLVEALPGLPDNIHADGHGGYLVSLVLYADSSYPVLTQTLAAHPNLRKMIVRVLYALEAPFKLLQDVYPNPYAERLMHSIGTFEGTQVLDFKKTSIVLRIDETGKVLDALYSNDQKVYGVSSAFVHDGYLWLGSPFSEYVQRVPLAQAFPDLAVKREKREPRVTIREKKSVSGDEIPDVEIVQPGSPKKPNVQKKPTTTTTTTTTTTPRPTTTTQRPTTTTTTTTPRPTTTTQKPTTTTPKPTTTTPKPTTTTPKPAVKPVAKEATTKTSSQQQQQQQKQQQQQQEKKQQQQQQEKKQQQQQQEKKQQQQQQQKQQQQQQQQKQQQQQQQQKKKETVKEEAKIPSQTASAKAKTETQGKAGKPVATNSRPKEELKKAKEEVRTKSSSEGKAKTPEQNRPNDSTKK